MLTENNPGRPDRQRGQRDGAPPARTSSVGPVPASRFAGFSDAKAAHLRRYITDQARWPLESPPMSRAASRASLPDGRRPERAEAAIGEPSAQAAGKRGGRKQAQRKRLHIAAPPTAGS
ncbi:hypothetical protein IWQ56_001773, partial [Coemansia nantahalensis]